MKCKNCNGTGFVPIGEGIRGLTKCKICNGKGEININMELSDTIKMMNSADYKERFKAEYYQNKIRYDKLDAMTVKYEAGTLNFEPKCSLELLKHQKSMMGQYIRDLKIRAEIEGINLNINENE